MIKRTNTFLLVGCGDFGNRGCEAIIRGTKEVLSRVYPNLRLVACCLDIATDNCPANQPQLEFRPHMSSPRRFSANWWNYRILHRNSPAFINRMPYHIEYSTLRDADCALEIGGDLYTLDYGRPTMFMNMDNALMSTGKPLILWGASIGPFSCDKDFESVMADHLRRFHLICARESETVRYLATIGVDQNVQLVADPAFLMSPERPMLSDKLAAFIDHSPIGLNLSPLIGRYIGKGQVWQEIATDCIRKIVDSGIDRILLIPHVFQQGSNDFEFMAQISRLLPGWDDRLAILPSNLTAPEYKWVISKTRMFIGARTHTTIAALSSGIPTISIGYSTKAKGLNKDIYGHLDWLVAINDFDSNILMEKITNMMKSESEIRKSLQSVLPEMMLRAEKAGMYLQEITESILNEDQYK